MGCQFEYKTLVRYIYIIIIYLPFFSEEIMFAIKLVRYLHLT